MKILIVEDDFSMRLTLQVFLKELGSVDTASDGQEALEKIEDLLRRGMNYDLICLDILMRGISGVDVLHRLRVMEHSLLPHNPSKVLMTTSNSDKKVIEASVREHCNGYLLKPFDKAKLLHYLEKLELINPEE